MNYKKCSFSNNYTDKKHNKNISNILYKDIHIKYYHIYIIRTILIIFTILFLSKNKNTTVLLFSLHLLHYILEIINEVIETLSDKDGCEYNLYDKKVKDIMSTVVFYWGQFVNFTYFYLLWDNDKFILFGIFMIGAFLTKYGELKRKKYIMKIKNKKTKNN
jgi:diacylglycerol kinase